MSRIHLVDGYKGAFVNFRAQLIDDLVRDGHIVTVSAPDIDPEMASALAERGAHASRIALDRVGVNPLRDFVGFMSIIRAIRSSRADVVMAYSSKAIIYGMLASFACRVKVRAAFVTGLGYTFVNRTGRGKLARFFQHFLYRIALRIATIVFFQNEDDVSTFRSLRLLGPDAVVHLTNGSGVDLVRFSSMPVVSPPTFLMIGRLLKGKGVVEYCHAAAVVRKHAPEAKFLLAGWADVDNPDSVDVSEFTRTMSDSGVEFLGRLQDVRPALNMCSVFVLPSYREGTPRSTLEALATGRAVVTTDAPGCKETVQDGYNGFMVPIGDVASLAEAMLRYIDEPGLATLHGRRSRGLAEERFDVHAVNSGIIGRLGLNNASV